MIQGKGILQSKMQRKLLTILTVFTLVVTSWIGQPSVLYASTVSNVGPASKIENGAILHAWCWSFNTIKNNMKDIAAAGYTSVQTSPASKCVVGNSGSKDINNWYYAYQPTDYKVGNYQLGTESEFAAMCSEADKYGIKIIVDVVANHVGNTEDASSNLKNISNWYHTTNKIANWNSRYDVTQLALEGMPDLNTQNKKVQNYIRDYLVKCIKLGADGFRFDAAKHIELPDDSGFGGDFWPTVLNNNAEYQYGEILQDSVSREKSYAQYMNVTASNYGIKLRNAIGANDFSTSTLLDYDIDVSQHKLVTWVESHDNYANGINDWGSSEWMNDEQIKLAWAVIAARKESAPLFFSRPVGGGGKSWDNRFPGQSKIGDRGSSLFKDDEVAAVNKFRNAMEGQNEYLRNPNGNKKVLMIERGTRGVVIINLNSSDFDLSSVTNLASGTYTNQTDNSNVFTVSDGRISGKLPARSVVVLSDYNKKPLSSTNTITLYYYTGWSTAYAHYKIGNGSWTEVPGVKMSSASKSGYKKITINLGSSNTLTACFNNGNGSWDSKEGNNYYFSSAGTYTVKNGSISTGSPS